MVLLFLWLYHCPEFRPHPGTKLRHDPCLRRFHSRVVDCTKRQVIPTLSRINSVRQKSALVFERSLEVLYRVNRVFLVIGSLLLLPGIWWVFKSGSWEAETVLRYGKHIQHLMLGAAILGTIPVLSWAQQGALRAYRRFGPLPGTLATFIFLVLTLNLSFWLLVGFRFLPAEEVYKEGQIFWVGHNALLFGHGYWSQVDGYWQHQTVVRLQDGTVYRGPTLDLITDLRYKGARNVWGSWCYTGNYPYIRKDLITGQITPWPGFVSYNKSPGLTIPIWLGASFVRLSWPKDRYTEEPEVLRYFEPDTLDLVRPTPNKVKKALDIMYHRRRRLPEADSISWQPVVPDTLYSVTVDEYWTLSKRDRRVLRELESKEAKRNAAIGVAQYWVRGQNFPLYIRVPARIYRPPANADAMQDLLMENPFRMALRSILEGLGGGGEEPQQPENE